MDSVHTRTVIRGVTECDPVVLMVSDNNTRRLVFLPVIHDSENKNGKVKGTFVYQRKRVNEFWDDNWEKITIQDQSLSKLKSGEGYRLDLSTDAVTKLIDGLMNIKGIAEIIQHGHGDETWIPAQKDIVPLLEQLISGARDNELAQELSSLSSETELRLSDLVLNARIRAALDYWEANKEDDDETAWQEYFSKNPWIFTLLFSEPIVILKEKMYVGGTNATGKGGKNVDYGLINSQTRNTAVLEIKTPIAKLLGSVYRDIYRPSPELAGAVVQAQNYRYQLQRNIRNVSEGFDDFEAIDIPAYVLIGNTKELDQDIKMRSFELNRRDHRSTRVLTFDEVFEKLRLLSEQR